MLSARSVTYLGATEGPEARARVVSKVPEIAETTRQSERLASIQVVHVFRMDDQRGRGQDRALASDVLDGLLLVAKKNGLDNCFFHRRTNIHLRVHRTGGRAILVAHVLGAGKAKMPRQLFRQRLYDRATIVILVPRAREFFALWTS